MTFPRQINISEVRAPDDSISPNLCSYTTKATLNNTPIVIDSGTTFGITPYVEDIILGALEGINLDVKINKESQKSLHEISNVGLLKTSTVLFHPECSTHNNYNITALSVLP